MLDIIELIHWGALFQIVLIDILLGGDNAVVIALACRNLPENRRTQGIVWGTAGAIVLRIILIAFALSMLQLPFIKLLGGILLVWIGIKLLIPEVHDHKQTNVGFTLASAIKTIIVADFVMSLDNVIAIAAAASHADTSHQLYYVTFGLVLSVPIIVWGSTIVLKLIDKFPIVVILGAALLGWIAGGMVITDVFVIQQLSTLPYSGLVVEAPDAINGVAASYIVKILCELLGAIFVVLAGMLISKRKKVKVQS